MTQHQKHFQRIIKQLLTLHMNIILCEVYIFNNYFLHNVKM